jgi:hypothetical protein
MAKSAGTAVVTDEELDSLEAELEELELELSSSEESDEDESDDDDEFDAEDESDEDAEDEESDEDESVDEGEGAEDMDKAFRPMFDALQQSITSIVNDEEAENIEKGEAISITVAQFAKEANRLLGGAAKITKSHDGRSGMNSTHLEKRLTDLHDKNVALEKKLNDVTEERQAELRVAKARTLLGKRASAEEVTKMANLMKTASADDLAFIESIAKRSQVLEKSSGLFEEIGSTRAGTAGASTAVDQLAQELQKSDSKLTRSQAIAKAYESLGDEAYLADEDEDDNN